MKNQIKILGTLILLCVLTINIHAQNAFDFLQKSDFDNIYLMMENEVDIQINRKKQVASKKKAINILKAELDKLNPDRWELIHRGEADEAGNSYFIAKVYNTEEKGLRLFVHLEGEKPSRKITSIRFRNLL
ncbi:MAG: DUF4783 domain-containing protein [Saprospiraceae bacterium]|nr:DUF4783 domain-containing protein [Bacteroidia bacterium]MBT8229538.1 DUF4783 domain-containing protein [Bacteroidia bacterium]NNF20615.1 DUF4783 domain-containing protein [Saprospiraceae bacterium]NNK90732.1 DUF4783 domain-containing protein [Saprospiraceae bacterium]